MAWGALGLAHGLFQGNTREEQVVYGALVGFITYAVYNGTEFAIRKAWTWDVAARDMLWGTLLSTAIAFLVYSPVY